MSLVWPDVDTRDGAHAACKNGAYCAFIVAGITTLVVILAVSGVKFLQDLGIGPAALVDVTLFVVLGIFLLRCSRIAAVIAFLLYLGEQAWSIKQMGFRFNLVAILFILYFLGAVRGAFSYHALKKEEDAAPAASPFPVLTPSGAGDPPAAEPAPKKQAPVAAIVLALVLAAGLAAAAFFAYQKGWIFKPKSVAKVTSASETFPQDTPLPASSAGKESVTLKLKRGGSVSGKIVYEDETYYTIEVFGGKQEIVIKEDVASAS